LEIEILSYPDAVYYSEGKAGRIIFRKGGNIVITESGSMRGQVITSYGPSGPRGESGVKALGGGNPTDPGEPITEDMIVKGEVPSAEGGYEPIGVKIAPKL
jgi:hypothetical protein